MPNPQNCTGRDFSMYDAMDDEQLRQILRDDASNTEGEDTDMELMLHIMEVLAKRRREANQDITPEEALDRFNKKYTYTDNSLISEERPAKRKTTSFSRLQRWVATIAALLVLVFGSALTAQAFGFDIFEIIVRWTQETFHLGYIGQTEETNAPTPSPVYSSLCDALKKYNVNLDVIPTWMPDGYLEEDVKIKEAPTQRVFTAQYTNTKTDIRIRIADFIGSHPVQVEQSGELLELVSHNGIDYYIFKNNDQLRAVWIVENYECYIMGDISISELKEIINSIQMKG